MQRSQRWAISDDMAEKLQAPFKAFTDIENYFAKHTNYERMRTFKYTRENLDLERIRKVLDDLGRPDESAPIFHIAGTKGKGSVCAFIASILRAAGLTVGLFSKPHLLMLHERLSINGVPISNDDFVRVMNELLPFLEEQRLSGNPLTFFDTITIAALQYFSRSQVDAIVLEVGLGGRLDSTNVVNPLVSIITSIDFDHTNILGNTLEKIAAEKAGIMKTGVPVISGVQLPGPKDVIEKRAFEIGTPIFQLGSNYSWSPDTGKESFSIETWRRDFSKLHSSLLGDHQKQNAAIAIAAIQCAEEALQETFTEEIIRNGIRSTRLAGRIEKISNSPIIILDVAHNPSAMKALCETLQLEYPNQRMLALVGMTSDKELERSLSELLKLASDVIYTQPSDPTSAKSEDLVALSNRISPDTPCESEPKLDLALEKALQKTGPENLLCITGSFYLAGAMLKLLKERPDVDLLE